MDKTQMMPGASKAPAAASPGSGSGNVPFAPGLMSGKLGTTQSPPLARELGGGTSPLPQSPGGPGPGPGGPSPSAPPSGPGLPAPGTPAINPQLMIQFYDSYMQALIKWTEGGGSMIGGVY